MTRMFALLALSFVVTIPLSQRSYAQPQPGETTVTTVDKILRRERLCTPETGYVGLHGDFVCFVTCKPHEIGISAWRMISFRNSSAVSNSDSFPQYGESTNPLLPLRNNWFVSQSLPPNQKAFTVVRLGVLCIEENPSP